MYWDEDKKQGGNKEIQKTQFIHKHTVGINIITRNNIITYNNGESGADTNAHRTSATYNSGNAILHNSNTKTTYEQSYTIVRYLIKI